MDKVISARVDESVIQVIESLARSLGTSKKAVIENAIRAYSSGVKESADVDVFAQTCGAWKRKETIGSTVKRSRAAFRDSMMMRQR